MVKNRYFPINLMKTLFSISIMQLCFICMLLIPAEGIVCDLQCLALKTVIPEMTTYAVFTAAMAPLSYYIADKYINKQ